MNRTAIVLPALIIFGYFFWTFGDAMKEYGRELNGNFDHQPHRWNDSFSVNARLYNNLSRICDKPSASSDRRPQWDRRAYCVGDDPPMPGFVAPFEASVPGAVKPRGVKRCACVGRLQSSSAAPWSVLPEETTYGKARVVYGLRGDTVERIDVYLPPDSHEKLAKQLAAMHRTRGDGTKGTAVMRWHRDQSSAELARTADGVRLSLIGGDEHYAVSGKSRPISRVLSSWIE